mgnify:FL=1
MSFEEIMERSLGKGITIHLPGDFSYGKSVRGKLIEMEGAYFVEGHCNQIPLEDISSIREGKRLDVEIEDFDYFHGGLLN